MSSISQLQVSVDSWLARDDVAVVGTDFPQILLIAESNISRNYRFAIQEAQTTVNITGQSADLPADFLEVRNPFIDDNKLNIQYKTPKAIRSTRAWINGSPGGSFYTLEGNGGVAPDNRMQITIAGPGTVSDPVDIVLNYYARIAALDTTVPTDTNWLIQNHYDVYLYETLAAACNYIQESELEQKYLGECFRLRDELRKHENRKRWGAEPKVAYGNPRMII